MMMIALCVGKKGITNNQHDPAAHRSTLIVPRAAAAANQNMRLLCHNTWIGCAFYLVRLGDGKKKLP
jgi:hypothetical protein